MHLLRLMIMSGISEKGTSMSETIEQPEPETHEGAATESSKVFSHSPVFYWWPIWAFGGLFWLLQSTGLYASDAAQKSFGFIFAWVLLFVLFSTTVRLRGAQSVIFGLSMLIVAILIFTAGMTGAVASFFSSFDINMSNGFYLFISLGVFFLWILMFGIFDRLKHWQAVPGQLHERRFFGSGDIAQGGLNVSSKYVADDFLRHRVLGLGIMGDLKLTYPDGHHIEVPNVIFAKRRNDEINKVLVIRTSVDI